ncbi:MAG: hypothetical protein K9N62_06685 [Verrucomicrobia bacterium]|jgi:hypothetical protein|nr:hypothetical protein [Verrucomicrobiota bacterium]
MKTKECIHLLKALADETLWRIVRKLLDASLTVNQRFKSFRGNKSPGSRVIMRHQACVTPNL